MSEEGFCPEHGPYNANLGACPYCGSSPKGPAKPRALEEDDDLPTDIGGDRPAGSAAGYDDETDVPRHRAKSDYGDIDDEDPTEIPHRKDRYSDMMTELEVEPTTTLGLLWVKKGSRRGRYYELHDKYIVGREEGKIILNDPKVSAIHARFIVENNRFVIWDMGSSNGTYVNGKKIREATILEENDEIKIGETLFVIKLLDSRPKPKPRASSAPRKSTSTSKARTTKPTGRSTTSKK